MNPSIRDGFPGWGPTGFPESTAYEAGFLTTDNAGWRERDPSVDADACIGCSRCYLYCPDGAVRMEGRRPEIDLRFCKGCGICVRICPKGAITMEARQ